MKKILLLFAISFILSCSKNDSVETIKDELINITIGNESFVVDNQEQIISNENCDDIFVSGKYFTKDNPSGFRIKFQLTKKGAIVNILLANFQESGKTYESADFNPKGIFSIKNFVYDQNKTYLYFDFEGYLVFESSNIGTIDIDKPQKFIRGNVKIKNVINTTCNSATSKINFKTPNTEFSTTKTLSSYDNGLTINQYKFILCSEMGNKINFQCSTDLWNQQQGVYSFDQNTIENRINFEKYIGNIRATQLLYLRPVDWILYETSGSYTILDHVIINGIKITKGIFTINIYQSGTLIDSIINEKFEIIGT